MRILSSLLLGAALIGTGAAAPAATRDNGKSEAKLASALEGRVAGKPVSCISMRDITSTEIFDGTAILYRVGGGRVYVNRPKIAADALDDDDILVTKTYGSQLCNLDTVKLIDRGSRFEHGFVGLGDFVPYTRAAKS